MFLLTLGTSIRFPIKPEPHTADVGKYETAEAPKKASSRFKFFTLKFHAKFQISNVFKKIRAKFYWLRQFLIIFRHKVKI